MTFKVGMTFGLIDVARTGGPRAVRLRMLVAVSCIVLVALACAGSPALARQSQKKSIWGPASVNGKSQFPIYHDLGVGIYQTTISWTNVAPSRPVNATDPSDAAYAWPPDVDYALREAAKYRIRVTLQVARAPQWANGGRSSMWVPERVGDFADFVEAAAHRYPTVRLWMIWGEPSRQANFMPLTPETRGKPLTSAQAQAPRRYSKLLDAAYGRLKSLNRRNLVIGGNTFTAGDILPLSYIKAMRLSSGRPPRMDLYGHNPFTARYPDLGSPLLEKGIGFADFSDLDVLARRVDRYLARPRGKRNGAIRLFLSEFLLPTDHPNREFNFYFTRRTQARWLAAALRISRKWKRIYTLGWFGLYDDPPLPTGDEVNRGLIDVTGHKKPAYGVFRRG